MKKVTQPPIKRFHETGFTTRRRLLLSPKIGGFMRFITLCTTCTLAFSGCGRLSSHVFETYSGNGTITTEQRQVGTFQGVEFEGAYEVVLTQGPTTDVRIETDNNLLEHITTTIEKGRLIVSSEGNLSPTKAIKVYITNPNFNAVNVAGSAHVRSTTPITSDKLSFDLAGSGDYDLEIHVKKLASDIAGSGSIKLTGDAASHSIDIAGSGDLLADSLRTETANVDIAGSGYAKVYVSKRLDASIAGSGNVRYHGVVTDVHSSIMGSGKVERWEY
jgi:hypothetical protein